MDKTKNNNSPLAEFANCKAATFVNVGLPENLATRLETYILKRANKKGKKPEFGLQTTIMRMALTEFLDKYENNLTL